MFSLFLRTQWYIFGVLSMVFFGLFCVGQRTEAVVADSTSLYEVIHSFAARVQVRTDNAVDIVETIVYDSGPYDRHGVYRDLRLLSSQGRSMRISDVRVYDEHGEPYLFELLDQDGDVRIKIGDPGTTFRGQRTYVISYTITRAVAQFDHLDEIYWNVVGHEWTMPIEQVSAIVHLPNDAQSLQRACYIGERDSTETCLSEDLGNSTYAFFTPRVLESGEDLTIAVGFKKGSVQPYTAADNAWMMIWKYIPWMLGLGLPFFTLICSFGWWKKYGRDSQGRGVIVPEYDVPDQLTPLEASGILRERVNPQHISAQVVYLATRGYIRIEQIEQKKFGFFTNTDYVLHLTQSSYTGLDPASERLMRALFGGAKKVLLSSLKDSFYVHIPEISKLVMRGLKTQGYYKNLGRMYSASSFVVLGTIGLIVIWIVSAGILPYAPNELSASMIIAGLVVSTGIFSFFVYISPSKTEKGVTTREAILGLKEYLQIAERDRLQFHNAPEKKPEVFEKLLPYAMVLGVTSIWVKEFADVYAAPPSWFTPASGQAFSVIRFGDSLNTFGSVAGGAMTSSPGSSGGGSAGGGGGGGGGGSW